MDCLRFENLLDTLCDGTAPADDREAAQEHAGACDACARLFRLASGQEELLDPSVRVEFARSVLELTSGAACGRARQLMSEALDRPPVAEQTRMMAGHILHCAGCRRFASTLQMVAEALPAMAEIDPGPEFTRSVLEFTRRAAPRPKPRRAPGSVWERLILRPLFVWEAAYAGTALFALIFLNPLLPAGQSSSRVLSEIQGRAASVAVLAPVELATVRSSISALSEHTTTVLEEKSLSVAGKLHQSIVQPVRDKVRRLTAKAQQ